MDPLSRQLIEKGETKTDASKLAPLIVFPFFSLLRKPAGHALRTAALVRNAFEFAVFAAAKTSGRIRRCGGEIVKPARFAAAKRRPSGSATTQAIGRPITQRVIAPVKRARKRPRQRGKSLLFHSMSGVFFVQPAVTIQPKDRFSGELEGCFYLKSSPSNVLPSPFVLFLFYPFKTSCKNPKVVYNKYILQ